MKNYTLTINEEQLNKLKNIYSNAKGNPNNQYIFFETVHNNVKITAYTSGKVVLMGDELSQELIAIKDHLDIKDYEAVGSDEVGTGDVFGPVVVCASYVSLEDIPYLEDLGVKDSKNMDDKKIIAIAPKIAERLVHALAILPPEKYNDSVINKKYNLNKIKAVLHNHVIYKVVSKVEHKVPVIIDQFCTPQQYFNYLKTEKFTYNDINFYTKAESVHISVAASSIIARYAFLAKMQEYSKELGVKLLKGANKDVDDQILSIVESHGKDKLKHIAKINFKNITKLNLEF